MADGRSSCRVFPHSRIAESMRKQPNSPCRLRDGMGSATRLPPSAPIRIPSAHKIPARKRSEEHTSELQSLAYLVCRLLLEKKNRCEQQREAVREVAEARNLHQHTNRSRTVARDVDQVARNHAREPEDEQRYAKPLRMRMHR